jgi:signal transduction histidine kinase
MPATSTTSAPSLDPRDAFLDLAAHQLRTPLTPLLMLAHLIGDSDELPESLRAHASLLRENVERAARLVDELADFGRLRAGRLRIEREDLDFGRLVADGVVAREPDAADRRIRLELTAAVELPRVRGDAPRLRRAIDTLVANAITHADAGSTVVVRARAVGGAVALTVADQGRGLSAAALAGLVDPPRAGGSRGASHLGVGLALAHAVAELHGGTLTAHSDGPARGATFTLRLPAQP